MEYKNSKLVNGDGEEVVTMSEAAKAFSPIFINLGVKLTAFWLLRYAARQALKDQGTP